MVWSARQTTEEELRDLSLLVSSNVLLLKALGIPSFYPLKYCVLSPDLKNHRTASKGNPRTDHFLPNRCGQCCSEVVSLQTLKNPGPVCTEISYSSENRILCKSLKEVRRRRVTYACKVPNVLLTAREPRQDLN